MYQHGVASDSLDLVTKLVAFLSAQGWTINQNAASGPDWRVHLSKGAQYVNLMATPGSATQPWASWTFGFNPNVAAIHLYVGTGYNGASAWNAQAGGPAHYSSGATMGVACQLPTGPLTGYFFYTDATADNVVAVVEKSPGVFAHFGWGMMVPFGVITGGAYFFGTMNSGVFAATHPNPVAGLDWTAWAPLASRDWFGSAGSYFRADVDSHVGKWITVNALNNVGQGGFTGKFGTSSTRTIENTEPLIYPSFWTLVRRSVSVMNGQVNLFPTYLLAARDAGGYSLIGAVPNIFHTLATQLGYAPASELLIGADTYTLFHNYAVKKVP